MIIRSTQTSRRAKLASYSGNPVILGSDNDSGNCAPKDSCNIKMEILNKGQWIHANPFAFANNLRFFPTRYGRYAAVSTDNDIIWYFGGHGCDGPNGMSMDGIDGSCVSEYRFAEWRFVGQLKYPRFHHTAIVEPSILADNEYRRVFVMGGEKSDRGSKDQLKTEKWQIDENDGTAVQAGTLKAPVKHFNEAMEPTTNSGDYAFPGAVFVENGFCQDPDAGTFKWNKNY